MNIFFFTPLGFLLFVGDFTVVLIGINVSSAPILLMASFILGLFFLNLLEVLIQPISLIFSVKTPFLVMEGEEDHINIRAENKSRLPKGQIYIILNKEKIPLMGLKGKENKEISIPYRFEKRGVFSINKLKVRYSGVLGLFFWDKNYKIDAKTYVYPLYYPIPKEMYLVGDGSGRSSYVLSSSKGEEFHSLRDYQPQDPIKIISWKASAKRGKLQSKTFERLTKRTLSILIDNVVPKKDEISEKEFDQLLRFVHSILLSSFSMNIPIYITDMEKESFSPQDICELRKFLGEIELKEGGMINIDYQNFDLVFSLNFPFWEGKLKSNSLIGVEFHKSYKKSYFAIYTPNENPMEFLNTFFVRNQ